ncbi:MAG TPA: Npt1/Npt2 family nucleotide transporter [Holophaga sp.]|nr:Npt1/Npt2 family nucleotide transporter [Holophaga sp.]
MTPAAPPFGRIRSFLWPIHRHELRKLVPMLLLFFFISLVYSLLRNTKDALVVTAPGGGAGLIPFIKVYGTIPGSVLIMLAYAWLSRHMGKKRVFQVSIGFFMAFFLAFAVVYPHRDALEPVAWATTVRGGLGGHLAGMARHWVLALFYVMSELWGSVALSLLFWGFANDITRVEESKRFYALFGIGANLALVAVRFVNPLIHALGSALQAVTGADRWTSYLRALVVVVLLCGAAIIGLYRWIHARVLTDPRFPASVDPAAFRKPRVAMSMGQGIRFLAKSRYLRLIALLVLSYGIAINLIEVAWKNQLGLRYPDPGDYQDYMAGFSMATGLLTLVLMLFVSGNLMRRFGWTFAALVTPVVLAVTGAGFFGFILGQGVLAGWLARLATTPAAMSVHFGAIQNVMSKSAKYSLFDPTKEMAYIPLDQESKVRGKAAIDVVGARLGKAGGSLIQQALLAAYGSIGAITGPTAVILAGVIGVWIWATASLGGMFKRLDPA